LGRQIVEVGVMCGIPWRWGDGLLVKVGPDFGPCEKSGYFENY